MTPMSNGTVVGFVGLGNLGQAMSLNLLDKGWALGVFDAVPRRIVPVIAAGAHEVDVPDLGNCDVLCIAVSDDAAVRKLLNDRLLGHLTKDHTLILHSTVLPSTARSLAELVAPTGARFLDVPVSGGAERARSGKLTLFAGGEGDDLAAVRPLLDSMAENVFHMGPVGAGSATKLANQLITFSALAGVGEALRLAGEFDVREEDVLRAVATGTGDTWIGRNWGFYDRLASDYDRIGTPVWQRPWSKDLWDVVAAGRESRLALPVAGLLAQILAETVEDHAHASELGVVQ